MQGTTQEVTLKLIPLDAPIIAAAEKPDHDAWLTNDNASLVDSLYHSSSQTADSPQHNRIHHCEQLQLVSNSSGYQLETHSGTVQLESGDVIALTSIQFLVTLQVHTVELPEEKAVAERNIMPSEAPDIWSSHDEPIERPQFADPFANQQMPPVVQSNTPMLLTTAPTMPQFPMHAQQGLMTHSDPLNFLYPSTETHTYSQQPQRATQPQGHANVLHDLGINEQQTTLVNRHLDAGKPTYLEQSPMDMLDEYLVDDVPMPSAHAATVKKQLPVQQDIVYAPTIHDDESRVSVLSSMKQFFLRKKHKGYQ